MPNGDEGQWLIDHRVQLERGEAAWLERLAEFDATTGWYADGQLSCVDWLVWFVKMGRSTAFEKVRVARQLRRRPIIAEAFRTGRISYSAARTITRAEDPDEEVDEALVTVAESGSPADVERAVRTYQAYRDQELPPAELVRQRRGICLRPTGTGLVRIEGFLTELEAAELSAALASTIDREDGQRSTLPAESPAGDCPPAPVADEAGPSSLSEEPVAEQPAESPAGDWWDQHAAAVQLRAAREADALLDLVRAGAAINAPPSAGGPDRYVTHVIVGPDGAASLLDGTPVPASDAARIACDTASVAHHHNQKGEPLSLGRKTKTWSTAQRRAALVRDGGRCRFPGCGRRVVHLHHYWWWEKGGPTDIANGFLLCTHHHTLIHERRFTVDGEANATLTFKREGGRALGATSPLGRRVQPV